MRFSIEKKKKVRKKKFELIELKNIEKIITSPNPNIKILINRKNCCHKEICLLKQNIKKLNDKNLKEFIIPLILQNYEISLREIDWFVTNFAKAKQNEIPIFTEIYKQYRSVLKHLRGKFFDRFNRSKLSIFLQFEDVCYKSTTSQILFLIWFYEKGYVNTLFLYKDEIKPHLKKSLEDVKQRKKKLQEKGNNVKRLEIIKT